MDSDRSTPGASRPAESCPWHRHTVAHDPGLVALARDALSGAVAGGAKRRQSLRRLRCARREAVQPCHTVWAAQAHVGAVSGSRICADRAQSAADRAAHGVQHVSVRGKGRHSRPTAATSRPQVRAERSCVSGQTGGTETAPVRPRGKRARARAGRWRALLSSKSRSLDVYAACSAGGGLWFGRGHPRAFPTDAEAGARGITGAIGRNSGACPESAASSLGLDDWPRCGRLS